MAPELEKGCIGEKKLHAEAQRLEREWEISWARAGQGRDQLGKGRVETAENRVFVMRNKITL